MAMEYDAIQCARWMMSHGASLDRYAARHLRYPIVGGFFFDRDVRNVYPIHVVRSLSMLQLLLQHGADVNARTSDGYTLLGLVSALEVPARAPWLLCHVLLDAEATVNCAPAGSDTSYLQAILQVRRHCRQRARLAYAMMRRRRMCRDDAQFVARAIWAHRLKQ